MNTLNENNFSAHQMKQKIDKIDATLTEFSDDKKKQFESALEQMMISMDEQIEEIESASKGLSGKAREKMDRLVLKLQLERQMFEAKLKATQSETGEDWLRLKDELRSDWNELTEFVEDSISTCREKVSSKS